MAGEQFGEVWAVAQAAGPVDVRVFIPGTVARSYRLGANPVMLFNSVDPTKAVIQNLDASLSIELGVDRSLAYGQGLRIAPNATLANGSVTPGTASMNVLERFARAAIPAPGTPGRAIQLTDYDQSEWLDTGAAFFAIGQQIINVRAYHAVGDSVTDDRVAIQNAINALDVNGGIVFFPQPPALTAYMVGAPGITCGNGVRLQGASAHNAVIIGLANTGYSVVTFTGGSRGEVAWLQLQAGGAANTALNVKGYSRIHVHDCRFYGACTNQIVLDHNNVAGAYGHRIDHCEIDCSVTAASVGILLTNTAGVPTSGITSTTISENWIVSDTPILYVNFAGGGHGSNQGWGNLLQARTAGVGTGITFTANCNADIWTSNYIENFATGISVAAGGGTTSPITVDPNYFENCTTAVTDNNANQRGLFNHFRRGLGLSGRFASARQHQTGSANLGAGAVASLGVDANFIGFVMVIDRSHGRAAIFEVEGGIAATALVYGAAANFTVAAGTANHVNVYWSAGNARYEIQNSWGGAIAYECFEFNVSV